MVIRGALAVISGASSGIGRATALALGLKGAHVILLARRRAELEAVAHEIQQDGGRASIYPVDLADSSAVEQVINQIITEHGPPDILFNNAGVGRWLYIEETSIAEAQQMMAVPYFAAFQLTRGFLPAMRQVGRGHVLNMTSPAAFMAWEGAAAYISARFAMRGFAKALQAELHGSGLKSTLMIPGKVSSDYFANNPGSEVRVPALSRMYKTLTPEEVAMEVIRVLERERQGEVIFPRLLSWTARLHQWMPSTVESLVQLSGSQEKQSAFTRIKPQLAIMTGLIALGLGLYGWRWRKENKTL